MKVILRKITKNSLSLDELEIFKQFNLYKTLEGCEYIYGRIPIGNRVCLVKQKLIVGKAEVTTPTINIDYVNFVDTLEGTSLEGQHLSGKQLIIVGVVNITLIVRYYLGNNYYKYSVKKMKMPFSTFIVIPQEVCNKDQVYLRYLIEDVSVALLGNNRFVISITPLIQYIDEYI